MNNYFTENKQSLFLILLILIGLSVILYFFILQPLLYDYAKRERDIDHINDEIKRLQTEIEDVDINDEKLSVEQITNENKVPPRRGLDDYILSLQAIETISDSKFEYINIVYDSHLDRLEELSMQVDDNHAESEEDGDSASESDEEEETDQVEEPTIDPELLEGKPDDLHVMTLRIRALARDYEHFLDLIKLIEKEERISIVTYLQFDKANEEDMFFSEESTDLIPFEIEVTTFYYE